MTFPPNLIDPIKRQMARDGLDGVTDFEAVRELKVAAEGIEAMYGPNAYSDFLRRHGRRPDPSTAAAIGCALGGRVRADDGKLYPATPKK